MVTLIIGILIFSASVIVSEIFGMYSEQEIILSVFMFWPIWAYAKSNKAYMSLYLSIAGLTNFTRFPYCTLLTRSAEIAYYPIEISNPYYAMATGLVYHVGTILWLFILFAVTTLWIARDIKSMYGKSTLQLKKIRLYLNLFSVSVFAYTVCSMLSIWIFKMTGHAINIILFAAIGWLLLIGQKLYYRAAVKEWRNNCPDQTKAYEDETGISITIDLDKHPK